MTSDARVRASSDMDKRPRRSSRPPNDFQGRLSHFVYQFGSKNYYSRLGKDFDETIEER